MSEDLINQNKVYDNYLIQIMNQLAFQHQLNLSDKELIENLRDLLHVVINQKPKSPHELPEVWQYREDSPKHPLYLAGKKSYRLGQTKDKNPYYEFSNEYEIWNRGWTDGLQEAEFFYEGN